MRHETDTAATAVVVALIVLCIALACVVMVTSGCGVSGVKGVDASDTIKTAISAGGNAASSAASGKSRSTTTQVNPTASGGGNVETKVGVSGREVILLVVPAYVLQLLQLILTHRYGYRRANWERKRNHTATLVYGRRMS